MAYTPGFQNDIFISYAPVDNLVHGGGTGWVDQFSESLEHELNRLLGRRGAMSIWYERNVDSTQNFEQTHSHMLKDSATFVAITSRRYLKSKHCQEELSAFYQKTMNEGMAVSAVNCSRIFNVLIHDIPHTEWPEEFGQTPGYDFYDEDLGRRLRPDLRAFDRQLRHLAEEIRSTLDQLRNVSSEFPSPNPDLTSKKRELVFLCYSRADEEFSLGLARSAQKLGVRIWVDQWDIPVSADWDRSIDEALAKCDRLLIVLSPSSVNSDEVRSELRWALDQKKPVVPVLYQNCIIPRRLLLTQHIDFVSAAPDDEVKMEQVIHALTVPKKNS